MRVFNYKTFFIIIILLALLVASYFYYIHENQKQEILFFDVGQGDAIFVNLAGNNEILIDGGPDNSVLYKLGRFMPLYDRSLELMILTHHHEDHLFGLIEVLKRYRVKKILMYCESAKENLTDVLTEFFDLIAKEKAQILCAEDLTKLDLNSALLIMIYPKKNCAVCAADPGGNNSSLVFRLDIDQGEKILLTGDIEEKAEKEILATNAPGILKSDILKVPHHGSETSLIEEFLAEVSPEKAVISVGQDNKFGHPSLRTIKRLERMGVEILRTDEMGDIIIKE
ncbi:hypothetical protein COU23_01425 [Candidatus Kuenenbacteria bacterium CG10_big_fil_rev_8_21_14_0_10_36_11]|uniref:Metallo-beta-lactamase domain-containing protein n=1 Tax=Candidatus Kuenenbacteria bacterium CG10_big_fil_rev_8_21_14_0_10_36_11 TaxID=1974618 RepID=A0A2M6WAV0_9BACT|nr:MAG: hypothetical protein COU23_01425 [Candidatus Kuenenbacteria bacterium CG10_big_fil_rev_8_21_14_0_10_36_11]